MAAQSGPARGQGWHSVAQSASRGPHHCHQVRGTTYYDSHITCSTVDLD